MIVHGKQRGPGGFQPSSYIVSSGSALCIPTTMMTRTRCVITIGCLLAKDISLAYEFYHESVRPAAVRPRLYGLEEAPPLHYGLKHGFPRNDRQCI